MSSTHWKFESWFEFGETQRRRRVGKGNERGRMDSGHERGEETKEK